MRSIRSRLSPLREGLALAVLIAVAFPLPFLRAQENQPAEEAERQRSKAEQAEREAVERAQLEEREAIAAKLKARLQELEMQRDKLSAERDELARELKTRLAERQAREREELEQQVRRQAEQRRQQGGGEPDSRVEKLERLVIELKEQLERARNPERREREEREMREQIEDRRRDAEQQRDLAVQAREQARQAREQEMRQRDRVARARAQEAEATRAAQSRNPEPQVDFLTALPVDAAAPAGDLNVIELAESLIDAATAARSAQTRLERLASAGGAVAEQELAEMKLMAVAAQRKLEVLQGILEIAREDADWDLAAAERALAATRQMAERGAAPAVAIAAGERAVGKARSRVKMLHLIGRQATLP